MSWLEFIVAALAVHRLSIFVSKEHGPKFFMRKARNVPDKGTSAHKGIRCPWCVSVYASALATAFFSWQHKIDWIESPLYWLALSSAAICLNQLFTKDTDK